VNLRTCSLCFTVILAWPIFWQSAEATEAQCRQPETFELRIVPVHGEVKYDLTKSLREIQRSAGPEIAEKHYPLFGMAVQGFGVGYVVQISTMPHGDQLLCPILDGVEVRIGLVDRTVFIAKEVIAIDCLYNEALRHQLRHVHLEDEALEAFLPGFTRELRRALIELLSQPQKDAKPAKEKLRDAVETVTTSLLAPLNKERSWRREEVESAEELDRIRNACGDIEQRLREIGEAL
jgi:hypothetical protein